MSSGVTILSARYGVGTSTVDVKSALSSQTKDGKINLVVSPSSLNVDDPAPGQIKTLTAEYSINGGSSNTESIKDGNYLKIDAPPERVASGLQIVKAEYGYQDNFADVTDAIQNYVSNGSISITVSPSTVGIPDPNPSKPKFLKVDATINGATSNYTIADGKKFTLSAPALDTGATVPVRQTVASIYSTVWSATLSLVFHMFWFSTIFLGRDFGQLKFGTGGKWGFAAAAFIMPIVFPVVLLPICIFWWRLFSTTDVYF